MLLYFILNVKKTRAFIREKVKLHKMKNKTKTAWVSLHITYSNFLTILLEVFIERKSIISDKWELKTVKHRAKNNITANKL